MREKGFSSLVWKFFLHQQKAFPQAFFPKGKKAVRTLVGTKPYGPEPYPSSLKFRLYLATPALPRVKGWFKYSIYKVLSAEVQEWRRVFTRSRRKVLIRALHKIHFAP